MIKVIIGIVIGYFAGIASCVMQIVRMEKRENKKFKEIMESKER